MGKHTQVVRLLAIALLAGCDSSDPVATLDDPGQVVDLAVADVSANTVTLHWTQVDDGGGAPADYAARYGSPTLVWGMASETEVSLVGNAIGADMMHTFTGLDPATDYEFQVMSYRGTLNVDAVFGTASDVVSASTGSPLSVGTIAALPGDGQVTLSGSPASGGTPPFSYQWHRSTSSGFSVSPGTALAGFTSLDELDTDVVNGTTYFYRLAVTDAAGGADESDQVSATPAAAGGGEVLLLHETWNDGIDLDRWEDGYRAEHHSVVSDPTGAGRGQVLRAEHTDNGGASYLAHWIYGAGETNPTGEVFLRTWVYVPADFDGSDYAKMLIVKGNRTDDIWSSFGQAGNAATGANFFDAYVSYGAPSNPDAGLHFYTYHVDMPENFGHVGATQQVALNDRSPTPGAWHKFEFWLKQNTVGASDGAQKFWLDDVLVMEWTGLRFRTDAILQANTVAITFSSSDNLGQVWFVDDVFVYDRLPAGMADWP